MIITRDNLSLKEQKEIEALIQRCQEKDGTTLSYPMAEPDAHHFLLFQEDGSLQAVFAVIPYTDTVIECTAATLPCYRKNGFFTRLLQAAIEAYPNCDILFPVSGTCADTVATLKAMEAELDSTEFAMEHILDLDMKISDDFHPNSYALISTPIDDETTSWVLVSANNPEEIWGFCQTSHAGKDCSCLHHVEVLLPFRKKGVGTALIFLLLNRLKGLGIHRVILQVSGENPAAVALYKKTGFRVTETLSYYLY